MLGPNIRISFQPGFQTLLRNLAQQTTDAATEVDRLRHPTQPPVPEQLPDIDPRSTGARPPPAFLQLLPEKDLPPLPINVRLQDLADIRHAFEIAVDDNDRIATPVSNSDDQKEPSHPRAMRDDRLTPDVPTFGPGQVLTTPRSTVGDVNGTSEANRAVDAQRQGYLNGTRPAPTSGTRIATPAWSIVLIVAVCLSFALLALVH